MVRIKPAVMYCNGRADFYDIPFVNLTAVNGGEDTIVIVIRLRDECHRQGFLTNRRRHFSLGNGKCYGLSSGAVLRQRVKGWPSRDGFDSAVWGSVLIYGRFHTREGRWVFSEIKRSCFRTKMVEMALIFRYKPWFVGVKCRNLIC